MEKTVRLFEPIDRNYQSDVDRKTIHLKEKDLPLEIVYRDKRYVMILTRNNKLMLQKSVF